MAIRRCRRNQFAARRKDHTVHGTGMAGIVRQPLPAADLEPANLCSEACGECLSVARECHTPGADWVACQFPYELAAFDAEQFDLGLCHRDNFAVRCDGSRDVAAHLVEALK